MNSHNLSLWTLVFLTVKYTPYIYVVCTTICVFNLILRCRSVDVKQEAGTCPEPHAGLEIFKLLCSIFCVRYGALKSIMYSRRVQLQYLKLPPSKKGERLLFKFPLVPCVVCLNSPLLPGAPAFMCEEDGTANPIFNLNT
jgi:hypothetical protein